ncbi:MAG: hypothetical protein ACTSWX_02650 [Promethearchaeota archaeon]
MINEIGKVIRGENHILYWIQINNDLEGNPAPTPDDCAFGSFVSINPDFDKTLSLIGVISNTMLLDRDALRYGPRLAQDRETMNIIFPDFIDERIKIVKVLLIGYIKEKKAHHEFPIITPNLGDNAVKISKGDIIKFHLIDSKFQIGYFSNVMTYSKLYLPLMKAILLQLKDLFKEETEIIQLLLNNLEYQAKMQGGFQNS